MLKEKVMAKHSFEKRYMQDIGCFGWIKYIWWQHGFCKKKHNRAELCSSDFVQASHARLTLQSLLKRLQRFTMKII